MSVPLVASPEFFCFTIWKSNHFLINERLAAEHQLLFSSCRLGILRLIHFRIYFQNNQKNSWLVSKNINKIEEFVYFKLKY